MSDSEKIRILQAAKDGRLKLNEHGRYVIEGEKRPDRKTREKLIQGGLILWPLRGQVRITAKGQDVLSILLLIEADGAS